MKQGEEYIVETKDNTLKKNVCKITILETTKTTVYFQVEDGDRQRLLHKDFEKEYRIVEKIEKDETKFDTKHYDKTTICLLNEKEVIHLEWLHNRFVYHYDINRDTDYLSKFREIIEKLKTQLL